MRRFLLSALIPLALIAGGAAPIAHAQADCTGLTGTALDSCISAQVDAQTPPDTTSDATIQNDILQAAAAQTPSSLKPPVEAGASVFAPVMTAIASLFAFLVTAAMIALNYSVYYTVVVMGNYIHDLSAIGVTWRILRDIGNVMLIFGFLAAGLMTIMNVSWYGWGTKMLPKLLLAAVFLNFSLFFAEAIIDTGNLFATQFYTQISGGTLPGPDTLTKEGISGKIMQQLGVTQIYDGARNDPAVLFGDHPFFVGFLSIILFLVISFVLFSLAFMLIARFVVLIILIIVAPVGFAGWAVPKLEGIAHQWWSTLLEQTFTAPVLLLLLYVALAVITDAKFLSFGGGSSPDWLGLFHGTSNIVGFASVLLSFMVAMGLLLVVLMVAKRMSAAGAGWATKTAGSLTFGTVGLAGRYTGGLGASWLAKKARSSRFSRVPLVGTGITRGLEGLSKSSFDVRGSSIAGGALKTLKVDAGKAQTGGYKEALKQSIESRTKYASELKGKDFKDLSAEQQLALGARENEITRLKKNKTDAQKAGTLTPDKLKYFNEAIERAETELDTMHKEVGTERGSKLAYASTLANLPLGFKYLTANKEAAEKIKEEARKSKDDKDLEALKKMLKKAGGEEEKEEKEKKPSAEGGAAPEGGTPPPPAGGGH